jgi:hypothetical protein
VILVAAIVGGVLLSGVLKPSPSVPAEEIPTQPGDVILMEDDFEDSAYDGSLNSVLWRPWLDEPGSAVQQDGVMVIETDSQYGAAIALLSDSQITENIFVEMSMSLEDAEPDTSMGFTFVPVESDYYFEWGCKIWSGSGQADDYKLLCSRFDEAVPNGAEAKESVVAEIPVEPGSWHRTRIEIEPGTMKSWFYVDGELVSFGQPSNPDIVSGMRFAVDLSTYNGNGAAVTGRFDNVRAGTITEDRSEPGSSSETEIFSATFSGSPDEALQGFELSNPEALWVEDGALAVVSAPGPNDLHAYVTTSAIYPFRIERPMFFESSLLLTEGTGDRAINMYLIADLGGGRSWGPSCSLNVAEPAVVMCGQDASIGSSDWDMAAYVPVTFDTWHTLRIEINPDTMLVSYYVDGRLVGTLQPGDVDILREAAYSLDFSSWSPDTTSVTGRIDNVRVGYLDE